LPEAVWIESRRQSYLLRLGVVVLFSLRWRHIADRLEKAAVVEPVDPFERGEFHSFQRAPGSSPTNDLSLEQAIDCFGQRIVVTIANAAD